MGALGLEKDVSGDVVEDVVVKDVFKLQKLSILATSLLDSVDPMESKSSRLFVEKRRWSALASLSLGSKSSILALPLVLNAVSHMPIRHLSSAIRY